MGCSFVKLGEINYIRFHIVSPKEGQNVDAARTKISGWAHSDKIEKITLPIIHEKKQPDRTPQSQLSGRSCRYFPEMLRKAASGMTAPFPVFLQQTTSISARPRAEKRFMMAMRIWISAVWRSGSRRSGGRGLAT